MSSKERSATHLFKRVANSRLGNVAGFVLVPALILTVLLLPPISLVDRLLSFGYEAVGTDGAIEAADGARVRLLPAETNRPAWIKLEAVPPGALSNGAAGPELLTAAGNIPPHLSLKSPLYRLQRRGQAPAGVELTLPLSQEVDAHHKLDLYTWNGQNWGWLPGRIVPARNVIETRLDFLPELMAVMESRAVKLRFSLEGSPQATLAGDIDAALIEINPQGLRLAGDGQIGGKLETISPALQKSGYMIVPTLRHRPAEASAGLITPLLTDPQARERHLKAIVDLVESSDYDGIDLDYRGIDPHLRAGYTDFLSRLRQALPENKRLTVRVDLPRQMSTGNWDTGPYDWAAIGRIADALKVPAMPDPKAYAAGGLMEAMLDWAVGQVDRYKLQLLIQPYTTESVDGTVRNITPRQALEQLGRVTTLNAPRVIDPGQKIDLTLAGLLGPPGIQVDRTSGTYWFAYLDGENRHHTIYLENAAAVGLLLPLVSSYNLQGVALQNQPANGDEGRMLQTVATFLERADLPAADEYALVWRVREQDGEVISEERVDLSQPNYGWTAPERGGAFEIGADVSFDQARATVSRGSVVVLVATPTPTPSPTPTPTASPSPTPTRQPTRRPTATPTSAPTATPAPVQAAPPQPETAPPPAVAAVNVPFGFGIQADPRGNIAGNIGHIKALGLGWVKFQMAWKDVEPAPGNYAWAMWDELVNAYHANGIQILLSIPKAPDWARPPDDDKSVEGPPQDAAQYANFVAAVAGRYAGQVQAIEIWNEQNLWYEAGGVGRIDPAKYVELLQLSYRAIKGVNPGMIVVSGALTPAGNVGEFAVDDIDYLQQMYANGARGFFDALGAHPSGYNCPAGGDWQTVNDPTALSFRGPFENRHHSWCFRGTMEGYRAVMAANGDGAKAIIPTEFGWAVAGNPHPGYEYAADNTPEEQARWIVEAFQMAKTWGWVGPMFLWNLDYGVTASGTELASFGILNTPAYDALLNMPKE